MRSEWLIHRVTENAFNLLGFECPPFSVTRWVSHSDLIERHQQSFTYLRNQLHPFYTRLNVQDSPLPRHCVDERETSVPLSLPLFSLRGNDGWDRSPLQSFLTNSVSAFGELVQILSNKLPSSEAGAFAQRGEAEGREEKGAHFLVLVQSPSNRFVLGCVAASGRGVRWRNPGREGLFRIENSRKRFPGCTINYARIRERHEETRLNLPWRK